MVPAFRYINGRLEPCEYFGPMMLVPASAQDDIVPEHRGPSGFAADSGPAECYEGHLFRMVTGRSGHRHAPPPCVEVTLYLRLMERVTPRHVADLEIALRGMR